MNINYEDQNNPMGTIPMQPITPMPATTGGIMDFIRNNWVAIIIVIIIILALLWWFCGKTPEDVSRTIVTLPTRSAAFISKNVQ